MVSWWALRVLVFRIFGVCLSQIVLCLIKSFMLGFMCVKKEDMLGSVPSRSLHGLPRIYSSIRYRLCSK